MINYNLSPPLELIVGESQAVNINIKDRVKKRIVIEKIVAKIPFQPALNNTLHLDAKKLFIWQKKVCCVVNKKVSKRRKFPEEGLYANIRKLFRNK